MKNYLEVTVFVSTGPGGAYTARVESIESGAAEYPLVLPFALSDLTGAVAATGAETRGQPLPSRHRAQAAERPRDFGAEMFEALFLPEGRDILAGTISRAHGMTLAGVESGVRLRISMNLHDTAMADVAQLPWELMSKRGDDPFAVSDKTPLVRSFDVLHPTESRPFKGRLRILVVMSNPMGTPPLDLAAERSRIEQSWTALNVAVDFARPVRADLRRQLAGADYHVVHFMGHGDFDAGKGGVLLFERDDAERSPDPVSGKEFAVMLADEPLRLVYLNACKSGMTGITGAPNALHPFAGVASALIKKGVPAVVAMQFPISDRAAIDFATTFYERVAQRFPVEAAVAQGRKALYTDGHAEWVTPVLYLRSRDGVLFTQPEEVAAAPATVTVPPADPWGEGAADAARVFLAAPCETLKPLHRTLARELRAEGIRVVDSVPPPHEAAAHAGAFRALAAQADLCVHLMGDTPGEGLDETGSLRTYPVEQLRLGLDHARAQLVIVPDVEIETIDDAGYQQYLQALAARSYEASRFEMVRTGKREVTDAIRANLKRQHDARQTTAGSGAAGGAVKAAFVDSHDLDMECANELVTFLSQRHVEAFMHTTEGASAETFAQFGETLKNYPVYIIVSGKADAEWVTKRTNNARTSAVAARARILFCKYESGEESAISMSRLKFISAILRTPPTPIDALFTPPATA